MALMLDTWQQSPVFNPADPTQKKIESYAGIPGQYATYYFNRVPNPGKLDGLGLPRITALNGLRGLAMPRLFSLAGLLTYGAIGAVAWLAGTKTKPGRKVVRKVKALLPHRRK